jgi:ribonuclease HI
MTEGQGVSNRRMIFCENLLSQYNTDELYSVCDHCNTLFCICCRDLSNPDYRRCHYYPVVFIDGACSRNGSGDAVSGIGGSFGEEPEHQWSVPVDGLIDSVAVRTNQRAELLAAIMGVQRLGEYLLSTKRKPHQNNCLAEMVVATDSEYVCKGVSEWMPKWKVCCLFSTAYAYI